jgi:hypothetical protein
MKEGRMKGQAFVSFANEKSAERALTETHRYLLFGKPLVVVSKIADFSTCMMGLIGRGVYWTHKGSQLKGWRDDEIRCVFFYQKSYSISL